MGRQSLDTLLCPTTYYYSLYKMAAVRQIVVAVLCCLVAVVAGAAKPKLSDTKALPNNIMDTIVNGLVHHFMRSGQGLSRYMPEKTAQIPYKTDGGDKHITVKMSGQLKNFQ